MKKLTLFLLAFVLIASACKKEPNNKEIEEEGKNPVTGGLAPSATQNGFAINYTATWCGPCGYSGAPLIHAHAEKAPKGAIITAHAQGDPMNNSLYGSFVFDRTITVGIPTFWIGDITTEENTVKSMTTLLESGDAAAGVDYSYEITGTTMTVKTKIKFFNPTGKKYFLSVLVLEDGIDGSSTAGEYKQNGAITSYPNDDYHHDFVLRKSSIAGKAYGEEIASSPVKNYVFEKTYTITLDASWKDTYPVVIIWEKNTGDYPQYKYINSLKKK